MIYSLILFYVKLYIYIKIIELIFRVIILFLTVLCNIIILVLDFIDDRHYKKIRRNKMSISQYSPDPILIPQMLDTIYYCTLNGNDKDYVKKDIWTGCPSDYSNLSIGNVFSTREEALKYRYVLTVVINTYVVNDVVCSFEERTRRIELK